jgi:hypothetical protein
MTTKEPPKEKTCTKCTTPKPIEEFGKRKNATDGHYNVCAECVSKTFKKAGIASARKRKAEKKAAEKKRRNHRPPGSLAPREGDKGHRQWVAGGRSRMAKDADRMNEVLDNMSEVLPLQASLIASGFGTFVRQLRASGVVLIGVSMEGRKMKITYQRTEEVSL